MAFIGGKQKTEMVVYLTEYGRQQMLEQGFNPTQFSISDEDHNYTSTYTTEKYLNDLTGDKDDNVYSVSDNIQIDMKIIR